MSTEIVRHASSTQPIYLPAHMPPPMVCPARYHRILVGYDGTAAARRALALAATLTGVFGASLTVVSVVPPWPGDLTGGPLLAASIPPDDAAVHIDQLREAEAALDACGVSAELCAPEGDPARTIEQLAEEGDIDMIVLGGRRLGLLGRLLLGSTSEHVPTRARATVIVTH